MHVYSCFLHCINSREINETRRTHEVTVSLAEAYRSVPRLSLRLSLLPLYPRPTPDALAFLLSSDTPVVLLSQSPGAWYRPPGILVMFPRVLLRDFVQFSVQRLLYQRPSQSNPHKTANSYLSPSSLL